MRCPGTAALLALLVLSCGRVHREEAPEEGPLADVLPEVFSTADSLTFSGMFAPARDTLLALLETERGRRDEVLFRLLGLYHGQAAEDELVGILDSLELLGEGPLTGWKVSAMDLAGRPADALLHLAGGDPCLAAWLTWEAESIMVRPDLSGAPFPGAVHAAALASPKGSFSIDELRTLSGYAPMFPSLMTVLLRELRTLDDTAGSLRLEILEGMGPDEGRDLLLAELLAREDSGSPEYWMEQLGGGDALLPVAVEELLQRFPGTCTPSWDVADRLVSMGETELAREYSMTGDQWHRAGIEMAVLLFHERYGRLLEMTDAPDLGAPDSLRARAALYRAHGLRGAGRSGSVHYGAGLDFARNYPWHPLARVMAYNAGKYHDCEQEWAMGAEAYLVSLNSSGTFEGDERAHWRGGFCLYMSGRPSRADSLWRAGCETWPSGYWRDEMLFWRARLAGERGDAAGRDSLLGIVCAEHPWEFYGMLAGRRLGCSSGPEFPVFEVRLTDDPVCSLAVEMTARGYGSAALELLRSWSGGEPEMRAAALSLMGRHGSSLTILRSLDSRLREEGRMLADSLLWLYFPAPYRDLAAAATDTLMLDGDMLQGIMREESYFDRRVVSGAGARGVVQLMPATAADVARWYGLPSLTEEEFFVPSLSVPYGALYIDRQYRSFCGEQPLFLAAYNAGPANSSRWVGMHGWDPNDPEMYIEQITYRETRIYVKKVLRSAWIYERR